MKACQKKLIFAKKRTKSGFLTTFPQDKAQFPMKLLQDTILWTFRLKRAIFSSDTTFILALRIV